MERKITLKGRLANEFQANEVTASKIKKQYDCLTHIITNLDKFPKCDFENISWVQNALFDIDPIACLQGI